MKIAAGLAMLGLAAAGAAPGMGDQTVDDSSSPIHAVRHRRRASGKLESQLF